MEKLAVISEPLALRGSSIIELIVGIFSYGRDDQVSSFYSNFQEAHFLSYLLSEEIGFLGRLLKTAGQLSLLLLLYIFCPLPLPYIQTHSNQDGQYSVLLLDKCPSCGEIEDACSASDSEGCGGRDP